MYFTETILDWFRINGRELPWRDTHDPYAIWLSEIILQQTRIVQGQPYWERFMRRWPTVADLAAASEDEVLREWQGLGYYSRARNLHAAARQIAAAGGFANTMEGLRKLKGVGDYTAAAIGSFAFGLSAAVVDGNVYRVLARHFGIDTPINTTKGKKEFAALAHRLLPGGEGTVSDATAGEMSANEVSAYNQAIMDFGALVCTPTNPRCSQCPLAESCVALREDSVSRLPVKEKKLKLKERHFAYVYIRCQGHTAFHRRPAGDIWQGLYEPWVMEWGGTRAERVGTESAPTSARAASAEAPTGAVPSEAVMLRQHVRHVLTHQVLYADFWLWETKRRPTLPDDYFWIDEADIDDYGVPRLVELLLEALPPHLP